MGEFFGFGTSDLFGGGLTHGGRLIGGVRVGVGVGVGVGVVRMVLLRLVLLMLPSKTSKGGFVAKVIK